MKTLFDLLGWPRRLLAYNWRCDQCGSVGVDSISEETREAELAAHVFEFHFGAATPGDVE